MRLPKLARTYETKRLTTLKTAVPLYIAIPGCFGGLGDFRDFVGQAISVPLIPTTMSNFAYSDEDNVRPYPFRTSPFGERPG